MIIKKYDKLVALKNRCLPMSWGKYFMLMLPCVLLSILLLIFSPFLIELPEFMFMPMIILIIVGITLVGTKIYFNLIKWFSTALIVKDNKLYLVQLINYSFFQNNQTDINILNPDIAFLKDESYINMLNDWLDKKEISGVVMCLDKVSLINETNKYYRCAYGEENKKKFVKIPKAYFNFHEIIKEVQNG